eukprot:scaffold2169_cov152-Skeletonema_dohrnii-CCMP3373.AAC.1
MAYISLQGVLHHGVATSWIDRDYSGGECIINIELEHKACSSVSEEEREERYIERDGGGQGGNPSKWSFQFIPTSYLNHKST